MAHRGPDQLTDTRVELGTASALLGHARLSIVDLSATGQQPLADVDGHLRLIFNGEIYNHRELRATLEQRGHRFRTQTDGEVILSLYQDEGIAGFRHLNGIYAFALADLARGQLVLARDPLGVKPLFWSAGGEGLTFASEITALRAIGDGVGHPDPTALAQFLTFLWVPEPRSPYVGIAPLRPGTALVWRDGEVSEHRFVDLLAEAVAAPTRDGDDVAEAGDRVGTAVRRQLMADVPVAVMASGGIDSSLIWHYAGDALAHAFTIDWSSGNGSAVDVENLNEDTETVGALSRSTGVAVTYVQPPVTADSALPPDGSLFADPAYELTSLIAAEARAAGFKVLLSGQGGDEVFGGYRRHVLAPQLAKAFTGPFGALASRALQRVPSRRTAVEYGARLALASSQRDPFDRYMTLCSYSTARDRAEALGTTEGEVSDDVVWSSHRELWDRLPNEWTLLRKARLLDLFVYLQGLGLAYADRAGMRHGVEIRVPLLDLELVRWSFGLSEDQLVSGRTSKVLLRCLASETLGEEIGTRPKRGFAMPANRLASAGRNGGRGFRQGAYFAHAAEMALLFRLQS